MFSNQFEERTRFDDMEPHMMEIPRFSGKDMDPRHYFIKMTAFLQYYNINSDREKYNVFIDSLEGEALDLYLTLEGSQKYDLEHLEEVFSNHFRPKRHHFLETSEMLRMKKRNEETVSEYYLRLRKKANDCQVG